MEEDTIGRPGVVFCDNGLRVGLVGVVCSGRFGNGVVDVCLIVLPAVAIFGVVLLVDVVIAGFDCKVLDAVDGLVV